MLPGNFHLGPRLRISGAIPPLPLRFLWSGHRRLFLLPVQIKVKGKGRVHPITGHEGLDVEQKYSSTLPSTSALDGVGGQRHAPATLTPGKIRYPLYRKLGGPQGRSGGVRKISPPTGIRSPERQARSESLHRLSYPGPLYLRR